MALKSSAEFISYPIADGPIFDGTVSRLICILVWLSFRICSRRSAKLRIR